MKKKVINALVFAGALFCMYTTGKIVGHIDCLRSITNRYGKDISDVCISSDLDKHITITVHKKEKA